MTARRLAIVAALFFVALLLLPFASQVVWNGFFPLDLEITATEPIEPDLLIAACGRIEEVEHALAQGRKGEIPFRQAERMEEGRYLIAVPASGRTGPFDMELSYYEPPFLVLEFKLAAESTPRRKRVDVPPGRGPRSVQVTLP